MIDHRCKGSEKSRHHLHFISGSVMFIKRLILSAPGLMYMYPDAKEVSVGDVNAVVIEGRRIHF